jgi:hypothetical protein
MAKIQKRLTDSEAEILDLELKPHQKGRNQAKYSIKKSQWELILNIRTTPNTRHFIETQKKKGKNGQVISTVEKLQSEPIDIPDDFELIKISTSKTTGQQWTQHAPKKQESVVSEVNFEKIIQKYINPIKFTPVLNDTGVFTFDRLVYTDVHIGMTTNKNGYSLYGGKWDEYEIDRRLCIMIQHTLENKKSNVLIIDELGDFMDGWDGETVRKGHALPQNMDNEKAFDVGLEFKIKLIDSLAEHYNKIICNNICNDNHAGSFGYVVNKAFKRFIETRYSHVIVNNIRKFIDHYFYGKNCFILTHGKDAKHLKFGFKPVLDPKQIEKIDNYIKHHKLHEYIIEFSKGDSHQKIFDESTSDTFDYYNYGAFSPSSEWVQTNFKAGSSFFELFNYKENGQKLHAPFRFEWNINREETSFDYCD